MLWRCCLAKAQSFVSTVDTICYLPWYNIYSELLYPYHFWFIHLLLSKQRGDPLISSLVPRQVRVELCRNICQIARNNVRGKARKMSQRMSEKMSDYTMSEKKIYIYMPFISFRMLCQKLCQTNLSGWGSPEEYHSSSTCHGCLIHSLCHNWFANNDPISSHYSCVYIYIYRERESYINTDIHNTISSQQVPPYFYIITSTAIPNSFPNVWSKNWSSRLILYIHRTSVL